MANPRNKNRPGVQFNSLSREIASPSLGGVRTIWNGAIATGLTPQRLAEVLMNAAYGNHYDYLTLAEEMEERDLHYAGELGKRKLAVSKLQVIVESASDSKGDIKLADAVRDLVRRPGFYDLVKDLMDGIGKGYSVAEIMWDRSGPQWLPAQYIWRDPHFFTFDWITGARLLLRDDSNPMGIELPDYKFIRHTPRIKSGIPIRGGFARIAAWAYMCKGYTLKDWLAFAEVFGMPLRLGKYDAGARPEDKDVLRMAVSNLGVDAAAIFPKSMDIALIEASKSASTDFFERLAQYLDNQITVGILGQTATTQGTPGKLGNESVQQKVREDIRDDDAGQLEETLQRDLVIPFINLNYGYQKSYPALKFYAPRKNDIAALTNALSKLVPLGLRVEASVIRDRLGLPDPPKGADILGVPPAPAGANKPDKNLDQAVNEMLSDWQQLAGAKPAIDYENRDLDFGPSLKFKKTNKPHRR